jgi:hypothetical protein
MKTVKKKVAKKVSTPNGAAKKPSSLRVNAGSNTELFTYLENVKQDFLRGYKYPTQLSMKEQIVQGGKEFNKADFSKVPSLTIKEIEQLRDEMEKAFKETTSIPDTKLTESEYKAIENARMVNKSEPQPPKEVTISSLLEELSNEVTTLNVGIYNHKDSLHPIIGDIPFADFEDIKQSPVPAITQLTQIISEVNAAKERLFQLTVAVQNTIG